MESKEPRISQSAAFTFILRDLIFRSKVGASWAYTEAADNVLKGLWSESAAECVESAHRREPEGMESLRLYNDGNYLVRLIRFPAPEAICECYLVAIASQPARRHIFPWKRQPGKVRYLTLEIGMDQNGEARTVLGEWTAVGHLNYGTGPEPTEDAFGAAVTRILAGESA